MIEASLGVVGACLPSMRPAFKKVFAKDSFGMLPGWASPRASFGWFSKSALQNPKQIEDKTPVPSNASLRRAIVEVDDRNSSTSFSRV